MRVLMLGWEFPPFITGGLGTACYGLTKALDHRNVEVLFALPQSVTTDTQSHVQLLNPSTLSLRNGGISGATRGRNKPKTQNSATAADQSEAECSEFQHAEFLSIPVAASSSYAKQSASGKSTSDSDSGEPDVVAGLNIPGLEGFSTFQDQSEYVGNLIGQVLDYARFCAMAARQEEFDVIHAHDWLTYPAGLAAARISGKPLIVHVHSTEFDRSGLHVHQQIYDIERRGMNGALKVITVSQLTKNTVVQRYGINPEKVEVVYNGVESEPTQTNSIGIRSKDKIVLYFGRITMQKGPDYFIRAANRVLEHVKDVKFVVAGSGDLASHMIDMAAKLGIGHKVLFTGFLRGNDIKRVFSLADVYVMPSVTEPFGIAPLEAMSNNVPVIISKSSGVSEVLTHALKVDFWDVEDIANKIIAVLKYPPLSRTLREHGAFEVRRLTWEGAAQRCEQIYYKAARGLMGVG